MWLTLVAVCNLPWLVSALSAEVQFLSGQADFRDVTLRWESPQPRAFHVTYCELQAWGARRCRTKTSEDTVGNEIPGSTRTRSYSMIVSGLRMSTTYSFQVRPAEGAAGEGRAAGVSDELAAGTSDELAAGATDELAEVDDNETIMMTTKGFSARATQCLPTVSEVEVSTGPHFGGRITVESGDGNERCAVDGDPDLPDHTYTLRIDHAACGSHVNETTVATFIVVQENLPILTHSTRRFLVMCTFQPETLTVRANLNLPGNARQRLDAHPEVFPLSESVNDVQVSRLQRHRHLVDAHEDPVIERSASHVLLVALLVVAAASCALVAWRWAPRMRRTHVVEHESASVTSENSLSDIDLDDFRTPLDDGVFTISVRGARQGEQPRCLRLDSYSHSEA